MGGPHVTITNDDLELTIQAPCYWHLVANTGDLPPLLISGGQQLRGVQTCSLEDTPRPQELHLKVATEADVVCKRVVSILLECFLVTTIITETAYWLNVGFTSCDFLDL